MPATGSAVEAATAMETTATLEGTAVATTVSGSALTVEAGLSMYISTAKTTATVAINKSTAI
jgi:uncharacterized cupin superfamily protein